MYQESYERNSQLYFDEKKRKVTQPMCMSFVEHEKIQIFFPAYIALNDLSNCYMRTLKT